MTRMPSTTRPFFYFANKVGGGKSMGVHNARSSRALAVDLRKNKKVLIRSWQLPTWMANTPDMSLKDHAEFDAQIGQLTARGVPLTEALEIASTVVSSGNNARVTQIAQLVSQGTSFADACHKVGSFDSITIAVYRAAEKTGDLAGACEQLAQSARRRLEVSGKAATLMIYPAIVLTIALIAAAVMLVLVVPTIGKGMSQSGIEMPVFTKILVNVGNFMQLNFIPLAGLLVVALVLVFLFRATVIKLALGFTRKAPFVRKVVMQQELTRFFSVMSSTTRSGIPLGDALHISSAAITHPKLNDDLNRMRQRLIEGGVFSTLISKVDALPLATRKLLVAADQAGDLESAFDSLAKDHAQEVEKSTDRLMAMLEPALILILFAIVGSIILAIMLPLMSMTSGAL